MWRALGGAVAFLLGVSLAGFALTFLETKFPGIWLPLALPAAIFFLLAMLPRAAGSRFPYALFTGGGIVTGWLYTRERIPMEPGDHLTKYAPYGVIALGAVGFLWWLAAIMGDKKRPAWILLLMLSGLAWMIAFFSSSKGGPGQMFAFFEHYFHLSEEAAWNATIAVRKTIHYSSYGLVGLVALFAARRSGAARTVWFALLLTLCYASFDEFRQSYVPGRTSSAWDVLLDLAGSATFVGVASWRKGNKGKGIKE